VPRHERPEACGNEGERGGLWHVVKQCRADPNVIVREFSAVGYALEEDGVLANDKQVVRNRQTEVGITAATEGQVLPEHTVEPQWIVAVVNVEQIYLQPRGFGLHRQVESGAPG